MSESGLWTQSKITHTAHRPKMWRAASVDMKTDQTSAASIYMAKWIVRILEAADGDMLNQTHPRPPPILMPLVQKVH